jgi:hypothetical protein
MLAVLDDPRDISRMSVVGKQARLAFSVRKKVNGVSNPPRAEIIAGNLSGNLFRLQRVVRPPR